MLQHRPSNELPAADHGWLKARHHFRLDGIHDAVHAPVKSLYVWNDDQFAPGTGFPLHFHRDVEIITFVRSGCVTHEDVLGNLSEVREGDVQVMSAGTGIRHSEFNRGSAPLRIFQIWFRPTRAGVTPRYATRRFPEIDQSGDLIVLASGLPEAAHSAHLPLEARARVLGGRIGNGRQITHAVPEGRELYLVASRGEIRVNGLVIGEGDGLAVSGESELRLETLSDAEIVMAEMA